MKHERDLFVNENIHEGRMAFRSRSHGFEFSLRIPRNRSGNLINIISPDNSFLPGLIKY